jgi:arginyl-tRNA synthetase
LGREHVEKGVKAGVFYQKEDGSIWVSAPKLQEKSPEAFKGIVLKDKLLLRSDGTSVYITQDIGTAILKAQDFPLEHSIYVVASEQILHFKTLFSILKMLGFPWAEGCYHVAYGMVTLPHGMGKIKSREGTAVDADELVAEMAERAKQKMTEENLRVPEDKVDKASLEIALAALKVFILQVSTEKDIQFDPTQTIDFRGDTGPAIQYSYARICSIFRKAAEQKIKLPTPKRREKIRYGLLDSAEEFALIRQLYDFPDIIVAAWRTYNISLLVNYLLTLTQLYASAYAVHPVLKAESKELREARLVLAQATAQVIKNGMTLLGASVLESM